MTQENTLEQHISAAISKIEAQCEAQILCVLATRASHYPTVPWVYATLISLVIPLILHFLTPLSYPLLYSLQLFCFMCIYSLLHIEPLRLALTPQFHKKARLKQRAKDLIKTQQALHPQQDFIVLIIAEHEKMAHIETTLPLPLQQALLTFTQHLRYDKAQAVTKTLDLLLPDLLRLASKKAGSAPTPSLGNLLKD